MASLGWVRVYSILFLFFVHACRLGRQLTRLLMDLVSPTVAASSRNVHSRHIAVVSHLPNHPTCKLHSFPAHPPRHTHTSTHTQLALVHVFIVATLGTSLPGLTGPFLCPISSPAANHIHVAAGQCVQLQQVG